MKIQQILVCLILLVAQLGIAHPGGHGHSSKHSPYDQNNIRTWHFQNEEIAAKGNFLLVKGNNILIETSTSVKAIPYPRLSSVDQNYVQQKLQRIKELNRVKNMPLKKEQRKVFNSWGLFQFTFLSILSLFLLFAAYRTTQRAAPSTSKNILTGSLLSAALLFAVACTQTDDIIVNENPIVTSNPTDMALAFAPYSKVTTRFDSDYLYVESNGLPAHEMMVGITAWIDQVPTPQAYTGSNAWQIPLKTQYSNTTLTIEDHFQKGAIAIAVNGIPIFNPYNASGEVSKQIGELDQYGGHSGRGDDYHYHAAPLHLETSSNLPIAYALDGYPVYGSKEPDGSAMNALDSYHGHEHSDGTYHYHGTTDFPYMIAAMRGVVQLDGSAPEDQITPQPRGESFRQPLRGISKKDDTLLITACDSLGSNGYILRYTLNNLPGDIEYTWDNNNLYTFIFHDNDGQTATEQHQK